jgi:hypothetical protein
MGPPNRLGAWRWYRRTVYQDGHPAKQGGYPIEQEVKMDSQLQPMWESLVEVDNLDGPPSTFPALSRSPATQPAPEEKEGLSLADVDKLCAEFGFHYDDDQGETLEILQDMISASLARWGHPSAAAPEPGESLATPPAPEVVPVEESKWDTGFMAGVCVALATVTLHYDSVIWKEIVQSVGTDSLLNYAANVNPEDWDLAGFGKYAQAELGKGKPLPAPQAGGVEA